MRRALGALGSIAGSGTAVKTVRVQGHRMVVDAADSLGLGRNGVHEPAETRLVQRMVRSGDTVVDIGANIGYYTLQFARLVGPAGKVYAFEPDPTNFSILSRNVELNGYHNVILTPKAVSNRDGTLDLYLCDRNAGMHRSYDSILCSRSIRVESVTLDRFLDREERGIDFLKIDIEGAEPAALEGMRALIGRSPHLAILTEFSPAAIREAGSDPERYIDSLLELGFSTHTIQEDGSVVPVGPGSLQEATRRIVGITDEELRSLGGARPEDPAALVTRIADRLRRGGHTGGLTRNLLFLGSSTRSDDDTSG